MSDKYLLTSNFTFGPLLARGVLFAPAAGETFDAPFFNELGSNLPVASGGVPCAWVERSQEGIRNLVPIAAQLSYSKRRRTRSKHEYVLLSDVVALIFREEGDRERVLRAPFADLDISRLGVETRIAPELFASKSMVSPVSKRDPFDNSAERAAITHGLRVSDAVAGAYSAYLFACDATPDHLEVVGSGKSKESIAPSAMALRSVIDSLAGAEVAPNDLEHLLLLVIGPVLLRYPLEDGWPRDEVLQALFSAARDQIPDDRSDLRSDLDRWFQRTREVLSDQGREPDLGDGSRLVARAIMLLLLRSGDPESVLPSLGDRQGVLRVGREVALLALALAALRSGLRALPLELKSGDDPERNRSWLEYLGGRIAKWVEATKFDLRGINVAYRSLRTMQGVWTIEGDGKRFIERPADFDSDLEKVSSMGRGLGFVLAEGGPDSLVCEHADGLEVELSLRGARGDSSRVVRFRVPLRTSTKAKRSKRVTLSSMPETASDLLEMLFLNGESEHNCRIAIDRVTGVPYVMVDQLVATLREDEYRRHLTRVAKIASEWMNRRSKS